MCARCTFLCKLDEGDTARTLGSSKSIFDVKLRKSIFDMKLRKSSFDVKLLAA